MTLLKGDIRLFKSDKMHDEDSGGGDTTVDTVISGQSNNIFDDISPLSRVYGDVNMRKVFAHVFSQNTDRFYGAHTIISKLPKDQKLGITLFSTNDWHDRRSDASKRVESYRNKGSSYFGYLYGKQHAGSASLTIFQDPDSYVPSVGEVLVLEGDGNTQYIKLLTVDHSVQSFVQNGKSYKKRILEITISQRLEHDFQGAQIGEDSNLSTLTEIYKTVVSNSGRYYGASPSVLATVAGDSTLKVESIFTQIVPNSLQEVPLLQQDSLRLTTSLVPSSDGVITYNSTGNIYGGASFKLNTIPKPSTLQIVASGTTFVDNGFGSILVGGTVVGNIDYETGVAQFNSNTPISNGLMIISMESQVQTTKIKHSL